MILAILFGPFGFLPVLGPLVFFLFGPFGFLPVWALWFSSCLGPLVFFLFGPFGFLPAWALLFSFCLGPLVFLFQQNYKLFDFLILWRTWWSLFQKRVVRLTFWCLCFIVYSYNVCQWLLIGRWFSPVVSANYITWPPWYNWNIVESGVKHHNPYIFLFSVVKITTLI
jgi:hypothetical protein